MLRANAVAERERIKKKEGVKLALTIKTPTTVDTLKRNFRLGFPNCAHKNILNKLKIRLSTVQVYVDSSSGPAGC
jgi:hypothetical protein